MAWQWKRCTSPVGDISFEQCYSNSSMRRFFAHPIYCLDIFSWIYHAAQRHRVVFLPSPVHALEFFARWVQHSLWLSNFVELCYSRQEFPANAIKIRYFVHTVIWTRAHTSKGCVIPISTADFLEYDPRPLLLLCAGNLAVGRDSLHSVHSAPWCFTPTSFRQKKSAYLTQIHLLLLFIALWCLFALFHTLFG